MSNLTTSHELLEDLLDDLATAIADDGIERHEVAVARAVTWARARGLDEVLVRVLADAGQPAVARERAFGALARSAGRAAEASRRDPRLVAA